MRILLIGEASFVHTHLKRGLEALGHQVVTMSDGNGYHNASADISLRRDRRWGVLGGLVVVLRLLVHLPRMMGNDVVQIHNYQFVPLRARWNRLLIRFLKRHNRCVVKGCFGDDPLVLRRQGDGVPRYSDTFWNGRRQHEAENAVREAEQRLPEIVGCWEETTEKADALVACLYEYHLAYDVAPYQAKLHYLPLPIAIPAEPRVKGLGSKINVLVGIQPARDYLKGAGKVMLFLDDIARRHPDRMEIMRVEGVAYEEYCRLLDAADVLVDQFYSFSPAMGALAAMARGTVVISGGEEEYYRFIDEPLLRPIINVSPEASFEENVRTIESVIMDRARLQELSRQSVAFVRKHHDLLAVARQYEALYSGLLGD